MSVRQTVAFELIKVDGQHDFGVSDVCVQDTDAARFDYPGDRRRRTGPQAIPLSGDITARTGPQA